MEFYYKIVKPPSLVFKLMDTRVNSVKLKDGYRSAEIEAKQRQARCKLLYGQKSCFCDQIAAV